MCWEELKGAAHEAVDLQVLKVCQLNKGYLPSSTFPPSSLFLVNIGGETST